MRFGKFIFAAMLLMTGVKESTSGAAMSAVVDEPLGARYSLGLTLWHLRHSLERIREFQEFLRKAGQTPEKLLSPAQLKRMERALKRGPEALGYATSLWTLDRVAELIEQECGVRYHPGHVWRILRQLEWSCQRPTGRARERDEPKIQHWKKVRWPKVKKTPPARGERSSFSTRAG